MNFLALDTSSVVCSVAISKEDEIFSSHKVNAESHSLTLIPTIQETLNTAKIKLNDLMNYFFKYIFGNLNFRF